MGNACDNCPSVNSADLTDADVDGLGNPCDLDDDSDGYDDVVESGTPLCGNGVNDDGVVFGGSDDGVVDDGCPGGPAQAGAYSEAQFNIGLGDQDPCGLNGWPSDFVSGGIFNSTDQVDIADLNSFLSPRRLDTSPGDPTSTRAGTCSRARGSSGPPGSTSPTSRRCSVAPAATRRCSAASRRSTGRCARGRGSG